MKKLIAISTFALTAALTLAPTAFAGTVGRRYANQQDRIAQGVRSGQLTFGETARLEGKEARLGAEIHNMHVRDGGSLTAAQRERVNYQQDRLSHDIYHQKHDAQTRP